MSSAFPSNSPNSRTWWSMSPKQPQLPLQDPHRQYASDKPSRSNGLNSIAIALGLKSKKQAVRAPHHSTSRPPLPILNTKDTTNIAPSRSPSSTPSRLDSAGPHTPLDPQQDSRRSLLTLSEIDPFAARSPSSQSPDLNRSPAPSNSLGPDNDSKSRGPADRVSYTSLHATAIESEASPPHELYKLVSDTSPKKSKQITGTSHRKQSLAAVDRSISSAWEASGGQPFNSKSSSLTTLSDKNRLSQPEATLVVRPLMRARGMTDSAAPQFLSPQPPSPRVIIRQPSVSRIGLPPSAPPTHELPLPPPPSGMIGREKDAETEAAIPPYMNSASSSSLSFASSLLPQRDLQTHSPRQKTPESSGPNDDDLTRNIAQTQLSNSPRTLKKALSYQSLARRSHSSSGFITSPLDMPISHKTPLKQRPFHQSKPATLPLGGSTGASLSTVPTESLTTEQKRGSSASGISLPGRKRLFSGSSMRRPSTSQCILSQDDKRSIFSVRSDTEQITGKPFEPGQRQPSPAATVTSSFWDEAFSDPAPHSPQPTALEYTPQKIMSSAEIAELAATLEQSVITGRERGCSILSASTMGTSDGESESISRAGHSSESIYSTNGEASSSSTSSPVRTGEFSSDRPLLRLSIFQSNDTAISPAAPDLSTLGPNTSKSALAKPSITSLPPPPRRSRVRPVLVPEEPSHLIPLPPPPGRKYVRPKLSVEKVLHHRAILRKPSFLEIDDDTDDKDTDVESPGNLPNGSFLDLNRESFDTMRSISE